MTAQHNGVLPAEQAYLAMLASRLKLDPSLKAAVEAEASKVVA